jgi:hypothetical protein
MGVHARHYDHKGWNRDMADDEIEARQEAFPLWAPTWEADGTGIPRGNVQTSAVTSRWLPPVWVVDRRSGQSWRARCGESGGMKPSTPSACHPLFGPIIADDPYAYPLCED